MIPTSGRIGPVQETPFGLTGGTVTAAFIFSVSLDHGESLERKIKPGQMSMFV
jgi:hypothetical protein